jgi:hypothetical protein
MRMQFTDGVLARLALELLSRDPELSVKIFRGRTTPEATSFELEIAGLASRIKEFIRVSNSQGLPIAAPLSEVA